MFIQLADSIGNQSNNRQLDHSAYRVFFATSRICKE